MRVGVLEPFLVEALQLTSREIAPARRDDHVVARLALEDGIVDVRIVSSQYDFVVLDAPVPQPAPSTRA